MLRRFLPTSAFFVLLNAASAQAPAVAPALGYEDSYQSNYAGRLDVADSLINISNAGFHTGNSIASPFQSHGYICANIYVFDPGEQIVSCCSCPISRNAQANLSVKNDLTSNSISGGVLTAVTVKIVATTPANGVESISTCNAASLPTSNQLGGVFPPNPLPGSFATGLRASATHYHSIALLPPAAPTATTFQFGTETQFSPVPLSESERTVLSGLCQFVQGSGAGFGICRSCRIGAQGGDKNNQ